MNDLFSLRIRKPRRTDEIGSDALTVSAKLTCTREKDLLVKIKPKVYETAMIVMRRKGGFEEGFLNEACLKLVEKDEEDDEDEEE